MQYEKNPVTIERESFRIIREHLTLKKFSRKELLIVERVIHATADFEYAELLSFSKEAIASGIEALKRRCPIVTDTRMAEAGINRSLLQALGGRVICSLNESKAERVAEEQNITRAMVSIIRIAEREKEAIFLIGNAPTALFTLLELFQMEKVQSPLVIGVPVGFVGAREAKEALREYPVPSITTRGPKGGTSVAVAILHALFLLAKEENHGKE